jgi:hypothetical protein
VNSSHAFSPVALLGKLEILFTMLQMAMITIVSPLATSRLLHENTWITFPAIMLFLLAIVSVIRERLYQEFQHFRGFRIIVGDRIYIRPSAFNGIGIIGDDAEFPQIIATRVFLFLISHQ